MKEMKHYKGSLIGLMSNKVKQHGGINMAQGIPSYHPPLGLINKMKEALELPVHQYAAGKGQSQLVDWIRNHYSHLTPLTVDHLLIVNGATEALSLLYTYINRLINEPYSVLAFSPVYESYRELPKIFGQDFIEYKGDETVLDIEQLKKTVLENNVKLIFIASPGNPWGHIWKQAELNEICKLANELNVYIIFDAVYNELYFQKPPYQLVDISNKQLFYVNSFSKMLSITGWRVGYLIAHKQHMETICNMHDYIGLSVSHPAQTALANYLKDEENWKKYVAEIRFQLKQNYEMADYLLTKAGCIVPKASGGYFIWCQLPKGINDGLKFALELYDHHKVAVVPGQHFSTHAQQYIRINLALPKEELERGLKMLIDFTKAKA